LRLITRVFVARPSRQGIEFEGFEKYPARLAAHRESFRFLSRVIVSKAAAVNKLNDLLSFPVTMQGEGNAPNNFIARVTLAMEDPDSELSRTLRGVYKS
jgi:hypothetical protein